MLSRWGKTGSVKLDKGEIIGLHHPSNKEKGLREWEGNEKAGPLGKP